MNLNTLAYIAHKINQKDILWCVGGSILLHFNDIVQNPRDIDILVNGEDAKELHRLLLPLGEHKYMPPKEPYLTSFFYHHQIKNIDIDIIGGFKIQHNQGVYDFVLDEDSISDYKYIDKIRIPLSTLEDWYVLYQLIPNKDEKVNLIEKHFREKGLQKPQILRKALNRDLPEYIVKRIEKCLKEFS